MCSHLAQIKVMLVNVIYLLIGDWSWLLAQALWMRKARGVHCQSLQAAPFCMYSKYAGSEFESADGTNCIVSRVLDLMAVLSRVGFHQVRAMSSSVTMF